MCRLHHGYPDSNDEDLPPPKGQDNDVAVAERTVSGKRLWYVCPSRYLWHSGTMLPSSSLDRVRPYATNATAASISGVGDGVQSNSGDDDPDSGFGFKALDLSTTADFGDGHRRGKSGT